jgi:flavin reductase (NADH)/flavin reductase/chlorophenol-4-monooxygenase component 1
MEEALVAGLDRSGMRLMSHVSEPAHPSPMVGNAPSSGVSTAEFRGAFANFTTTVSIIATDGPAGMAGLTCSAVCAVSDDPPLLLACVHGKNAANAAMKANKVMSVSCLRADQSELSQAFAGVGRLTVEERFALGEWHVLATGAPCSTSALATLDCEIVDIRDVGTHSIFVGKVVATSAREAGEPLVYQRRAYATTRNL